MPVFDIDGFENEEKIRYDEIALHFQSDILAEKYLQGLINWNGETIGAETF